ncbi:MAG: ribonuclease Z [Bacteroidota bacterium]|nr:ribonuclease Z [Bacteroidota bacterium]
MSFKILVLGCGSATPFLGRYQTSMLLEHNQQLYLLDCGEGIQMQMLKYEVKFARLNHIFISHLHGDHYLGLIGLLSTLQSWGRKKDLYLYGPAGLKEILSLQLKYQNTSLDYQIHLTETNPDTKTVIIDNDTLSVTTLPLQHRLPTTGFIFKEKEGPRKLIKGKIPVGIKVSHLHQLKLGNDVFDEGGNLLYKNEDYTTAPDKTASFAYVTDTIYDPSIVPHLQGVEMMFHETTFLDELQGRALQTYHSTTKQAANIAKEAGVKKLLIGHFSARYKDLSAFETEAREIFKETFLAKEGEVF